MPPILLDGPERRPAYIPPPPPPPPPPTRHPSDDELRQMARDVKKAGDRSWQVDNYEARMDTFARTIGPLPAADRVRLLELILEKDPNAPNSWLQLDRLDSRVAGGHVTAAQGDAVRGTMALAYAAGSKDVTLDTVESWLIFPQTGTISAVDIQQRIDKFTAGLPPDQAEMFRNRLGAELIRREMLVQAHGMPRHELNLGTVGARLLNETQSGRKALADLYANLGTPDSSEPSAQQRLMLQTLGETPYGVGGGDDGQPDGVTLVINAVAEQPRAGLSIYDGGGRPRTTDATYDNAAISLVRLVDGQSELFFHGDTPVAPRAEAMADLFMGHKTAVLDALTDPRLGQEEAGSSKHTPLATNDALALGNLFRMTILNPDLSGWKSDQMQRDVLSYANTMVHMKGGDDDKGISALGRVGMLFLGVQDGVKQGYKALEDDRAAQERVVGFFTDMVIDTASAGVTDAGPQGLLGKVVGPGVDLAAEKGKEIAKAKVTDFLFGEFDTKKQDQVQSDVNQLVGAYVQSLPGDRELGVGDFMIGMGKAIDSKRG